MATDLVTCSVCGSALEGRHGLATTCGSAECAAEARRNRESARSRNSHRGQFLAVDRYERLHALGELVRWEEAAAEADARGEAAVKRAARKRAREIVEVLGFDPLAYVPDRSFENASQENSALGRTIAKRTQAMLRRVPGTTSELAEAAGIAPANVRAYLRSYLESGYIVNRTEGRVTWWEEGS